MFSLRNKKNIDIFWLKNAPYQELCNRQAGYAAVHRHHTDMSLLVAGYHVTVDTKHRVSIIPTVTYEDITSAKPISTSRENQSKNKQQGTKSLLYHRWRKYVYISLILV